MIRAVLVDDEMPAIKELEYFLKDFPDFEITGVYTNPLKAIEDIGELMPDVVFLDINMPQLLGMDAGSKIMESSPGTDIVFVTAYDQYAVEAFEIHALDYILKPIDGERFKKTIARITAKRLRKLPDLPRKLKIKCFGAFKFGWENQEPIKWRAEKTRELFAYLLLNHGRSITKDELLDKLWTEDSPDRAIRQLYNGIYYIRKALESYGVNKELVMVGNDYNLILGNVDYDVEQFSNGAKDIPNLSAEKLEELVELYTNEYLYGEDFLWLDSERARLSNIYYLCLIQLSEKYIAKKQLDAAEMVLFKAFEKFPFEENITERLLELYLMTNNKLRAVRHMEFFSKLLQMELGIKPDKKLVELYEKIVK